MYVSGSGVATASFGLPDLGITTMSDVVEDVRRISGFVHVHDPFVFTPPSMTKHAKRRKKDICVLRAIFGFNWIALFESQFLSTSILALGVRSTFNARFENWRRPELLLCISKIKSSRNDVDTDPTSRLYPLMK